MRKAKEQWAFEDTIYYRQPYIYVCFSVLNRVVVTTLFTLTGCSKHLFTSSLLSTAMHVQLIRLSVHLHPQSSLSPYAWTCIWAHSHLTGKERAGQRKNTEWKNTKICAWLFKIIKPNLKIVRPLFHIMFKMIQIQNYSQLCWGLIYYTELISSAWINDKQMKLLSVLQNITWGDTMPQGLLLTRQWPPSSGLVYAAIFSL